MKKVFVTGATGFLGQHLVRRLISEGHTVHILSRRSVAIDSVTVHNGDLSDGDRLNRIFSEVKPEFVFHLAADIRRARDEKLYRELLNTNALGTTNVLSAAVATGVEAFVTPGTFEEYGSAPIPFDESSAATPQSPYGVSKLAASTLVAAYGKSILPATVLRLPVVYGEGQAPASFMGGLVESLTNNKPFPMTEGKQGRDFLYVGDVVEAFIRAAENIQDCRGEIINVCSGKEISLKDVVDTVSRITGRNDFAQMGIVPYRENEQMRYTGTNQKMKDLLRFEPAVALEDGIRALLSVQ